MIQNLKNKTQKISIVKTEKNTLQINNKKTKQTSGIKIYINEKYILQMKIKEKYR